MQQSIAIFFKCKGNDIIFFTQYFFYNNILLILMLINNGNDYFMLIKKKYLGLENQFRSLDKISIFNT